MIDGQQLELKRLKEQKILTAVDDTPNTPALYIITPTYKRLLQKAEITRVGQALVASKLPIHWIIVEDTTRNTSSTLLKNFYDKVRKQLLNVTLLQASTPKNTRHRGVSQRNAGLDFIASNHKNSSAVIFFADDDNTYDERVFHEFARIGLNGPTEVVGVLPVGTVGGLKWEGPICDKNGTINGWHSISARDRPFPMDMAGFAMTVDAVIESKARFRSSMKPGHLESSFLIQVMKLKSKRTGHLVNWEVQSKMIGLGNGCRDVLVWHTKSVGPNTNPENKLRMPPFNEHWPILEV